MPDSKPSGGRPKREAEFETGDAAAINMAAAMQAVLSVDKKRITELEQSEKEARTPRLRTH